MSSFLQTVYVVMHILEATVLISQPNETFKREFISLTCISAYTVHSLHFYLASFIRSLKRVMDLDNLHAIVLVRRNRN